MISFRRSSLLKIAIALCTAIALVLFAIPSRALQVQVSPKTPQLGDTISVITMVERLRDTVFDVITMAFLPRITIIGASIMRVRLEVRSWLRRRVV